MLQLANRETYREERPFPRESRVRPRCAEVASDATDGVCWSDCAESKAFAVTRGCTLLADDLCVRDPAHISHRHKNRPVSRLLAELTRVHAPRSGSSLPHAWSAILRADPNLVPSLHPIDRHTLSS